MTEVANDVRNKNMPIQAEISRNSQSRCNVANQNFFFTFDTDCSGKAFSKKSDLRIGPEFVISDSFQLAYDYQFGELISLLIYLKFKIPQKFNL